MFETIKKFLVEKMNKNESDITMEATLMGDLGFNSIDIFELITACEEEFDIEIPDEDLGEFKTVGDFVKYLEEKKA